MIQVVSLAGSLMILGAFAAAQFRWMTTDEVRYIALNLVGAAILTYVALTEEQWGFLLLESVWALVSAAGLVRALRSVPEA